MILLVINIIITRGNYSLGYFVFGIRSLSFVFFIIIIVIVVDDEANIILITH